jgi:hypothetical protein
VKEGLQVANRESRLLSFERVDVLHWGLLIRLVEHVLSIQFGWGTVLVDRFSDDGAFVGAMVMFVWEKRISVACVNRYIGQRTTVLRRKEGAGQAQGRRPALSTESAHSNPWYLCRGKLTQILARSYYGDVRGLQWVVYGSGRPIC